MSRTFTDRPAVRTAVPLMVGLVGPSGGGKTFSALRLASGIRRVTGGDIGYIDTESRRALHYADQFAFRHVAFEPPFSPLDYLAAIEHYVSQGVRIIVVDSMSLEHEGVGGLLDMHDAEVERLSGGDAKRANAVTMLAWGKPKAARRKLLNRILQLGVTIIACFRAKRKLQIVKGAKEPIPLGWQAIGGDEYVYELTCSLLLPPGANGVPCTEPEIPAEKEMIKIPQQFRSLFAEPRQLDESIGTAMAEWARGAVPEHPLLPQYRACISSATLDTLEAERKAVWGSASVTDKATLKAAAEEARARLEAVAAEESVFGADTEPDADPAIVCEETLIF